MIAFIYSWIKNILIYIILVTIILNLLPQGQYRKYIKVFTGLVLIIIIIQPLAKLNNLDRELSTKLLDENLNIEQEGLKRQYDDFTEEQEKMIIESYMSELKNQIIFLLEQDGIYIKDVGIEVNKNRESDKYGTIEKIFISTSLEEDKKTASNTIQIDRIIISNEIDTSIKTSEEIVFEKKIKNILIDFYKLHPSNIHISIKKS
ncbi:MAG: stage III sporulation protein AF [Eubacteriales bacterium]